MPKMLIGSDHIDAESCEHLGLVLFLRFRQQIKTNPYESLIHSLDRSKGIYLAQNGEKPAFVRCLVDEVRSLKDWSKLAACKLGNLRVIISISGMVEAAKVVL